MQSADAHLAMMTSAPRAGGTSCVRAGPQEEVGAHLLAMTLDVAVAFFATTSRQQCAAPRRVLPCPHPDRRKKTPRCVIVAPCVIPTDMFEGRFTVGIHFHHRYLCMQNSRPCRSLKHPPPPKWGKKR
jgi:hypothetical protein